MSKFDVNEDGELFEPFLLFSPVEDGLFSHSICKQKWIYIFYKFW